MLLVIGMADSDPNSVLERSFICKPKEGSRQIMMMDFKTALRNDYIECKDAIKTRKYYFVYVSILKVSLYRHKFTKY